MKNVAALVLAAAASSAEGIAAMQGLRPLLLHTQAQEQSSDDPSTMSALQETPVELGPDGFPKLPEVSKMLGAAQQTLQGLTQEATSLEQKVQLAQTEKTKKMGHQKVVFEGKLHAQEVANRALVAQNKDITENIKRLQGGNTDIRTHAKQLEATNAVMRQELLALEGRLGTAEAFVSQALTGTDDSKAKELQVLEVASKSTISKAQAPVVAAAAQDPAVVADGALPPAAQEEAPTLVRRKQAVTAPVVAAAAARAATKGEEKETAEDLAEDAAEDAADPEDDDTPASLIAVGVKHKKSHASKPAETQAEVDARELIKVLQKGVASLSEEERASETRLKQLFTGSYRAGAQRQKELLATQQGLNATRASLVQLQGELHVAESHLQATQAILTRDLHDMGAYLQKLAHLALAPSAEAPRLTNALPTSIASQVAVIATPAAQVAPAASAPLRWSSAANQ